MANSTRHGPLSKVRILPPIDSYSFRDGTITNTRANDPSKRPCRTFLSYGYPPVANRDQCSMSLRRASK